MRAHLCGIGLLVALAGCGRVDYEPHIVDPIDDASVACAPVTLTSRRTFTPATSETASTTFDPARELVLPGVLEVAQGNAGNHWVRVELGRPSGLVETCCYQGGSSLSNPTSEPELTFGLRYVLERCFDGITARCENLGEGTPVVRAAGDVVSVSEVRMTVLNAAPSAGTTIVAWTIACP